MALQPNSTFGNYQIGEVIGEGGMGQVYLATDTTLDRKVAIKVLPESFAADADRIARFEQEAKTLASLNHPNIGMIFGLERQGDTTAIVMELVEGPTLEDRIATGPIPPEEALRIARQIIDGLEAAHDLGIVHRDLKPANIKLKKDGQVRLLDFGIAKPQEVVGSSGGGKTPTLVTPAVTETGMIMGTAAYMSPEQARGREVDQRTDIWAFGCLLYEMLTGQPAFAGEDVAETLARIITLEADTGSLTGVISPAVEKTIGLCLQKDLKKRIADIRDVRLSLQGEFAIYGIAPGEAEEAMEVSFVRRAMPVAAAVVITALMVGAAFWFSREEVPRAISRFSYDIPGNQQLLNTGRNILAVSPDGRRFAYNAEAGIYLREMAELEARIVPGTAALRTSPFFSPDGQYLAYFDITGQIRRIAVSGGASVVVTANTTNPLGASWAADNFIYFGMGDGIYRVNADGGTPELIIPGEGALLASPVLLPDGDTLLYSATNIGGNWDSARIMAWSRSSAENTVVFEGGADARYLSSGHLVYALGSDLFAVVFDANTLTTSGAPIPLVQGVLRAGFTASANFGVADNGTLVYINGITQTPRPYAITWVDRAGVEEPLAMDACDCNILSLSPDQARLALTITDNNESDVWMWSFAQQTLTRLSLEEGFAYGGVWSPDGSRIAYNSLQGIVIRSANGTGSEELVMPIEDAALLAAFSWSANDQLLFSKYDAQFNANSGMITLEEENRVDWLLDSEFSEGEILLSPDNRWVAYVSNETGRNEIFVRPFPDVNSGKWQVSTRGGNDPRWAPDGSALYYLSTQSLMAADIQAGDSFLFSSPRAVLDNEGYFIDGISYNRFEVPLDNERFLRVKLEDTSNEDIVSITIVENWLETLK